VGLEGVHIHDLRHTGNQFTANAGANTRELMVRMGHDSERAALIYLHSSDARQRVVYNSAPWPMRWARLPGPSWHSLRRPRSRADLAREWHAVRVTLQKREPVSGFEPLTCRLQGQSR